MWSKDTEGCWSAKRRYRPEAGCSRLGLKATLSLLWQNLELRTGSKEPNPWLSTWGALVAPAGTAKCPAATWALLALVRRAPICEHPALWDPVLAYYTNWQQNSLCTKTNYEGNQSWYQTSHVSSSMFFHPYLLLSPHHNTANKNSVYWLYVFIPSLSTPTFRTLLWSTVEGEKRVGIEEKRVRRKNH